MFRYLEDLSTNLLINKFFWIALFFVLLSTFFLRVLLILDSFVKRKKDKFSLVAKKAPGEEEGSLPLFSFPFLNLVIFFLHLDFWEVNLLGLCFFFFQRSPIYALGYLKFLGFSFFFLSLFPFSGPLSLWALLLLSGWLIFLLYVELYARAPLKYSIPSLFFFSVNLFIPLSLAWAFYQGMVMNTIPFSSLSSWTHWRNVFQVFLIPFIFLLPFIQNLLSLPFQGFSSIQGHIHPLWRSNPYWDQGISLFLDFLGKHYWARNVTISLHFIILHLLPFVHSLIWFWVFKAQDLIPLLWGIPLILISWFYGHIFYYFSSFVQNNLADLEKYLQRKEISPGIYKFSLLSKDHPEEFLPFLIDAYYPLEDISRRLSSPFFLYFSIIHLLLRWIISLFFIFFFSPTSFSSLFHSAFPTLTRKPLLATFPLRGPPESYRMNSAWSLYLNQKSSGLVILDHRMIVDTSIRDSFNNVLLLGELTTSKKNPFATSVLDPEFLVNGQKGVQYWLPAQELIFIDPRSLGKVSSVLHYFQRPFVKASLDQHLSSLGIPFYSSLKTPKRGFSRIEEIFRTFYPPGDTSRREESSTKAENFTSSLKEKLSSENPLLSPKGKSENQDPFFP